MINNKNRERKEKRKSQWVSASLILFALVVLWNQSIGNRYTNLIGFSGLILGIIGIWWVLK